jgi:hypothetical protein
MATAVPVSSHELRQMEFGSVCGMTARTKQQTSRRNIYPTVTSLHELRTEDYEDDVRRLKLKRHARQQRAVQRNMTVEASKISYMSVKRKTTQNTPGVMWSFETNAKCRYTAFKG